ncbi:MAG: hypothetical protein J6I40_07220 [Mailhella sp.]|nr:hypothetical protein [Mailhella sp.]
MESSSLGLLFGCAGVAVAFYGTQRFVKRKYGLDRRGHGATETQQKIGEAYDRLFILRLGCLVLSLAAACTWFLEPRPYLAGLLGIGACFLLWKAFRLRSVIVRQAREAENSLIGIGALAGTDPNVKE